MMSCAMDQPIAQLLRALHLALNVSNMRNEFVKDTSMLCCSMLILAANGPTLSEFLVQSHFRLTLRSGS